MALSYKLIFLLFVLSLVFIAVLCEVIFIQYCFITYFFYTLNAEVPQNIGLYYETDNATMHKQEITLLLLSKLDLRDIDAA